MNSKRPDWASDVGLYRHLQEALRHLARGRWSYDRRTRAAMDHLLIFTAADFPAELRHHFAAIQEAAWIGAAHPSGASFRDLSPGGRDRLGDAVVALFEAAVEDRTILMARSGVGT